MSTDDVTARAITFRELHGSGRILVCPNPWDIGTARILANLGFKALATTSAGLAFSLGRRDGDGAVSAEETFAHVRTIVNATPLPVTADLENGFGHSPDEIYRTIQRAGEVGLAGASIEDATYDDAQPLYDFNLAVERIGAAVEAARGLGYPFTLTARSEGFIRGEPDLDDTLRRLTAYEDVGADVLYAPGLPDESAIRSVCGALSRPFNYVAGVGPLRTTLSRLEQLGVRRVTIGTSFARASLAALVRAAKEVLNEGSFEYARGIPTVDDINAMIDPSS